MEKLVHHLRTEGMLFEENDNAVDFLTYNICWVELKSAKRFMYSKISGNVNIGRNKYDDITFRNIRKAGLCDFYFDRLVKILIFNLEHDLKVFISEIYESLCKNDKAEVNNGIISDYKKQRFKYGSKFAPPHTILNIFKYATFTELIRVFNSYLFMKQDVIKVKVNDNISTKLRNSIMHHNKTLLENEKSKNRSLKRINNFCKNYDLDLSDKTKKYLEYNPNTSNIFMFFNALCLEMALLNRAGQLEEKKQNISKEMLLEFGKYISNFEEIEHKDTWFYRHHKATVEIMEIYFTIEFV